MSLLLRSRLRSPLGFTALFLASAFALCPALRATGPLFQVKQTVRPSDLSASAPNRPIMVSGLSASGSVAGFYIHHLQSVGAHVPYPHAFVWHADTATLLDLNTPLQAVTSIATCLSPAGNVAGVGWTTGPGNAGQGGASTQFGFVWNPQGLHTFQSPDGTSIDAVVAVNDNGWVVGTYFGGGDYKRAFVWDGTASTDLGDFGDPDNSFVWPMAINNAGQVVGTVYAYGVIGGVVTATGFLWKSVGGLGALDANGDYGASYGVSINRFGQVAGAFLYQSSANSQVQVSGGFYWLDDVLTGLGVLGTNKGVFPFAINDAGQIIGTAYAANTLHLFKWAADSLGDLGTVTLNAGDTAFQLTGVNSGVNLVGYVTDANGQPQAVWRRVNEAAGTLHNVAAMLPLSVGFVADHTTGTSVLVNEAGRVACSGYSGGQPVVLLLLPDSDGDGMPDEWETAHNLNPYDPTDAAADADGDGLSNLYEFQHGTDPGDFYNGSTPQIRITKGDGQALPAGSTLLAPLGVTVTDGSNRALANAPVTFHVATGGGTLRAQSTAAPAAAVIARTDHRGLAYLFLTLPGVAVADIQITATAGGASAVTFHETSLDPGGTVVTPSDSPFYQPTDVIAALNDDGSLDVSWSYYETATTVQSFSVKVTMPDGTLSTRATVTTEQTSVHIDAPN